MKLRHLVSASLAALTLAAALPASAQFAKPEDAIKYRQSALRVMGTHFGRVGAMTAGRVPYDAAAAQQNIEIATMMSTLPWQGFGAGTEGGKAKPEIWAEQAKFKEYNEDMIKKMAALNAAAKTGNLDTLKTAFAATGGACKTCHDAFQAK
ncbi:MAG: cytochrome c [Burkholderiaceae bacterium]